MARNDPHSVNDPAQGRVSHLEVDLNVDFASKTLAGTATLKLAEQVQGPLDLDTRDLDIQSVKDGSGNVVKFSVGGRDPVMGQPLRLELTDATDTVTIQYATSPEASALQWLEPAMTAGGQHPYMFSQCQAIHARSVIPVQDSPSVRFSFGARITVPEALTVVMGAAPGEASAPEGGKRAFSFSMPQKIPAYLFSIAVGNITYKDLGPRSRVYTEPEMLDKAAWEFEGVDSMLQAAEKLFGPYRWDRFDFLVMPPSFPYGGMEHPRLTFLTPTLIAGDRSLVNVLAHELAHSWTGNLVTNATMNEFWLNEGFTVWAERRILEAIEGKDAMALSAAIGWAGLQEDIERFGPDSPHTRLLDDLDGVDPDEVYSRVPYEKGSLFVFLLEQTVGRETWDKFIRDYIDQFGFTSITSRDFEKFLDEKLPGVAERVGAKQWIDGPGLPDNAPRFSSPRLEELQAMAGAYGKGTRPAADAVKSFSSTDWQVFLGEVPKQLPLEECAWLDETFELSRSGNSEILNGWLVIAATSGYEPAYPTIREFLGAYGRMKFLKPVFKALHGNDESKALAREIFEANKDAYHPIARGGIERILSE